MDTEDESMVLTDPAPQLTLSNPCDLELRVPSMLFGHFGSVD